MPSQDVLTQIAANIRAIGHQDRQVIGHGHFEIYISSRRLDYLTYATPLLPAPAQWATAVSEMIAVFDRYEKRPRLEYIAELQPGLEAVLQAAGLACERRDPIMVLDVDSLDLPPSRPPLPYQRLAEATPEFLRAYVVNQSLAYGGSDGTDALDWLPNLQRGLAHGYLFGGALVRDGEIVSGATIQIGAGIGELAGVWTAPDWRGRGLAFAVCRQVLAEYAAAGFERCWLSAAPGAQRLYEKLGFVPAGTQLNYGRPA